MIKESIVTEQTHTLTLDNEAIIASLFSQALIPAEAIDIKVSFDVPGGGDYSNMTLPIDKTTLIKVTFKVRIKEC